MFVSEHPSAPVHADGLFRANVLVDAYSFDRVHVLAVHHPSWLVRTDWNEREVEGAKFVANLLKSSAVARVSSEEQFLLS